MRFADTDGAWNALCFVEATVVEPLRKTFPGTIPVFTLTPDHYHSGTLPFAIQPDTYRPYESVLEALLPRTTDVGFYAAPQQWSPRDVELVQAAFRGVVDRNSGRTYIVLFPENLDHFNLLACKYG